MVHASRSLLAASQPRHRHTAPTAGSRLSPSAVCCVSDGRYHLAAASPMISSYTARVVGESGTTARRHLGGSPHHLVLSASAPKSRISRSGTQGAVLSAIVVRFLRRRCRPTMWLTRVSRTTRLRLIFRPRDRSSACTGGTVGAVVFGVDGADLHDRPLFGRLVLGAGRGSRPVPVEAGAGHTKDPEQPLDAEVGAVVGEEGPAMEEVRGKDPLSLRREEAAPSGAGATRGRVDACCVQHLPDRGGREGVPEPGRFALDTAVAPAGTFISQAQHETLERGRRRRPSDAGAAGKVVPLPGDQFAVPGQQVPGVAEKTAAQRPRGSSEVRAASQNRSAGS